MQSSESQLVYGVQSAVVLNTTSPARSTHSRIGVQCFQPIPDPPTEHQRREHPQNVHRHFATAPVHLPRCHRHQQGQNSHWRVEPKLWRHHKSPASKLPNQTFDRKPYLDQRLLYRIECHPRCKAKCKIPKPKEFAGIAGEESSVFQGLESQNRTIEVIFSFHVTLLVVSRIKNNFGSGSEKLSSPEGKKHLDRSLPFVYFWI